MDQKQVCTSILLCLNELRLATSLCDITLLVGDAHIPAHKVVLAGTSKFFETLFSSDKGTPMFQINGLTAQDMVQILDFLYTGQIKLNKSNVDGIRNMALQLEIDILKQVCDAFEGKLSTISQKKQNEKETTLGTARTLCYGRRSKSVCQPKAKEAAPSTKSQRNPNRRQRRTLQQKTKHKDSPSRIYIPRKRRSTNHTLERICLEDEVLRQSSAASSMSDQLVTNSESETLLVNSSMIGNTTAMTQIDKSNIETANMLLTTEPAQQELVTKIIATEDGVPKGVESSCNSLTAQNALGYVHNGSLTYTSEGSSEDHVLVHNPNEECDLMTLIEIQNFLCDAANGAGMGDDQKSCESEGFPGRQPDLVCGVSRESGITLSGDLCHGTAHTEITQEELEVHYDIVFDGQQKVLVKRASPRPMILEHHTQASPTCAAEQGTLLQMLNSEESAKDPDLVAKVSEDIGSSEVTVAEDGVVVASDLGPGSANVFIDHLQPFEDGVCLVNAEQIHAEQAREGQVPTEHGQMGEIHADQVHVDRIQVEQVDTAQIQAEQVHAEQVHFHDYCITDSMKPLSGGTVMTVGAMSTELVKEIGVTAVMESTSCCSEGKAKHQALVAVGCETVPQPVLRKDINEDRKAESSDGIGMMNDGASQVEVLDIAPALVHSENSSVINVTTAKISDSQSVSDCLQGGTNYEKANISNKEMAMNLKEKCDITLSNVPEKMVNETAENLMIQKRVLPKRKRTENNKTAMKSRKRSKGEMEGCAQDETKSDQYKCFWCQNIYGTAEHMRAHAKVAHVEHMHKCFFCCRLFVEAEQCDNHMDWCRVGDPVNGRFTCPQCPYSAAKASHVVDHYRGKHTNKLQRTCESCAMTFQDVTSYIEHQVQVHDIDASKIPRRKIHQCPDCDYRTIKASSYKTHKQSHSNQTFTCDQCGKIFKTEDTLKKHIQKIHSETTVFKCTVCDFTSRYSATLNAHQYRSHHLVTSVKSAIYYCPYCDYSNVDQADLRKHERNKHSDDRPFLCSYCPKAFKHKTQITVHERIHTGARPFKCTVCKYAGRSKVALVTHIRHVHSTAKPYVCELCGFRTKGPSNLWFHKARCKKRNSDHPFLENAEADLDENVFQMAQIAE